MRAIILSLILSSSTFLSANSFHSDMNFQIAQRDVRDIPGKETKKAIIFDKGGVLTNRDYSEIYNFLGETLDLSPQDLQVAIKEKKILDENFWQDYSKSHQQKVSPHWIKILQGLYHLSMSPNIDMLQLVEELSTKNYWLGMLSNTTEQTAAFNREMGYYSYFTPLLLSYELGVEKPQRRIYEILIAAVDLDPENIIFIDNELPNVTAAKEVGIDAIHFTNADQLRRDLYDRGINVELPSNKSNVNPRIDQSRSK